MDDLDPLIREVIADSREQIGRDIVPLREWIKLQSAADLRDDRLDEAHHTLAQRVYNRAMHTGDVEHQADNEELHAYMIEAHHVRGVVPPGILEVYDGIQRMASAIVDVDMFRELWNEKRRELYYQNLADSCDASELY
ncbi:hypothetical protein RCH09_000809 [Actimicrobium sp. GrIS 1.19]|uniref:hypothetical protein n=1 Tax=Actimicrobium sp. GrIS 1.19 TaxID=3071708 RepID=UPI002E023E89|nr:hypothetical protein [Actimicrobium sp. GrIS 1.19]